MSKLEPAAARGLLELMIDSFKVVHPAMTNARRVGRARTESGR
jgi:hypothetical protein